jgi:carboxyl-terminal processing protease
MQDSQVCSPDFVRQTLVVAIDLPNLQFQLVLVNLGRWLRYFSMMAFLKRLNRSALRKWLVMALVSFLAGFLYCAVQPILPTAASPQTKVFEQVWQTVNQNFYDPKFNGVNWQAMRQKYVAQAEQAQSPQAFAAVVNQMLAELQASHTRFYTAAETEYYQLAGIFRQGILRSLRPFLPNGKLEYTGIGIYTRDSGENTFIRAILDGSPAQQAGLKVGDRILSVDGKPFQAVQSFVGKAGQLVQIQIQRTPDVAPVEIAVTPKVFDPATMFLDAMKASVEVIERNNHRIGYIHVWSYADPIYQQQLERELSSDRLGNVDGLIWDLRDGWGGANPTYLNPFAAPAPELIFIDRDGDRSSSSLPWRKPVVMLVNQGSRSGKEILAYAFRKYRVGKIVGSKTAGAVLAGRAFIMQDGSLLYLAVADVLVDGKRLEGEGISPDRSVPFPIEYAQGNDPQKQQAIQTMLQTLQAPN